MSFCPGIGLSSKRRSCEPWLLWQMLISQSCSDHVLWTLVSSNYCVMRCVWPHSPICSMPLNSSSKNKARKGILSYRGILISRQCLAQSLPASLCCCKPYMHIFISGVFSFFLSSCVLANFFASPCSFFRFLLWTARTHTHTRARAPCAYKDCSHGLHCLSSSYPQEYQYRSSLLKVRQYSVLQCRPCARQTELPL